MDAARTAVTFRDGLSLSDQRDLDGFHLAAGPGRRCTRGVVGLLMPLLTDTTSSLSGSAGQGGPRPERLIAAPDQLQANGLEQDIDHVERLLLLAQLCYAIGQLHKHGWVWRP